MITSEEDKNLSARFDAEHVWAYVEIAQRDAPPKTVPALRMGLFAVTRMFFEHGFLIGAKITHLPSGIALGSFVHAADYKAFIADLSALGESANTLSVAKMGELFAPIAIKHGTIDAPTIRTDLPVEAKPLNGAAS